MKALFVAHCTDFSGANKSFYSIIQQLKDKITIIVLVNQKDGELIEKLQLIGIKVLFTKYGWWVTAPRKNLVKQIYRKCVDLNNYKKSSLTGSFVEMLKQERFDFVYTNTSTVDIGARIAETLNIPHFWHVREFGKEDFGFKPLVSDTYRNETFNKAKKVIAISEAIKRKYASIVPESKIVRIYNGFEIDQLKAEESYHDLKSKISILVTGQVCEGKGQIQAIEAVSNLYKKGYPVKLMLAGSVDHSYLDPVLRKYREYSEWLTVLGQIKDVYKLRNDIDIELVCSRSEAFGRVTLEAMLHSIPVIGSNAGGNPELITDGENGLLFEYGHPEDLEKCILKLATNKNLYESIVRNAFEFSLQFTIEKTAQQVYETFKGNIE